MSRVEIAAARVRALIESRKLSAGDRIPSESELAARFQVCRAVLREAVSRLQGMGILEVRRGLGMYVGSFDRVSMTAKLLQSALTIVPRDLRSTLEFRRGIEQQAAASAAKKGTPRAVKDLLRLCDEMDRHPFNSAEGMRADYHFHRKIVDMTGNELMRNVMTVLHEFILAANVCSSRRACVRKRGDSHRLIVEAVRSGIPDEARRVMREHMDLIEQRLERELFSTGREGVFSPAAVR